MEMIYLNECALFNYFVPRETKWIPRGRMT